MSKFSIYKRVYFGKLLKLCKLTAAVSASELLPTFAAEQGINLSPGQSLWGTTTCS